MSKIADQLENRTQEWIQKKKKKKTSDRVTHWSMDKRAPGVLRKKKKKKKKPKKTRAPGVLRKKKKKTKTKKKKKKKKNSNNNAQSKFNERHVRNASHKRCQVANSQCTRVLALYALQIVQVERLSCNLCAISYDRSRFILSPVTQRNATDLFSTRSPRLQTVTGVRLSRYSCLVIPEGRHTIRQNTARLGLLCMIRSTSSFNIQHLPVIVKYTVCRYTLLL